MRPSHTMPGRQATHNCLLETSKKLSVCLGRCAYEIEGTHTFERIGGADNKENAFEYVGGYAEDAAGKSAPARFTGAVLHGLVEEAVVQMQGGRQYEPTARAARVYDEGLAMWIRKDRQGDNFGAEVIEETANTIIEYAEHQTGLPRSQLLFLSEYPVVVSYGPKNECWPRFADLVVARRNEARTPLMIIDLYFTSQVSPNLKQLCAQKLKALRYIKSVAVRQAFKEKGIKIAVLAWARPNLDNMAAMVTHAAHYERAKAPPRTIYLKGVLTDRPSTARLHNKTARVAQFVALNMASLETMLVKLQAPVIQTNRSTWHKFPTLVGKVHKASGTIKVLTPVVETLPPVLFFGGSNWTASRIMEIDTGTFKEATLDPLFIGKALDTLGEEKRGERIDGADN